MTLNSAASRLTRAIALAAAGALFALAPGPASADDTLTIMNAAIAPGLYGILEIVAQDAGFFKQEHVNFTAELVNSPSVAAQLVATGRGDICSLSAEAVVQGYDKGLRLQYFFAHAKRFSNVLAVLDDSPIKTLDDFKGKNIGEINVGSAGEVTAQLMLAGAGLKKNDFTFSPIGVGAQALEAMVDKHVDAVAFPYGEVVPMEIVGNVKMRVFRDPTLGDISNAGLAAAPATILAKADVLKRFSRAIVEASLFVRYNPAVAARDFLAAQGKATPEAVARETRELALLEPDLPGADPASPKIGAFSLTGMQILSRTLYEYGKTSAIVPAGAIVTDQFVAYANDFDHKAVIALAKAAR
jgi:NitT/TauT family transport system substrate-binding protein